MIIINIELSLEDYLLSALGKRFSLSGIYLLRYLFLRAAICTNQGSKTHKGSYVSDESLYDCLKRELHLQTFTFQGVTFSIHRRTNNSLNNIFEDWRFQLQMHALPNSSGQMESWSDFITRYQTEHPFPNGKDKRKRLLQQLQQLNAFFSVLSIEDVPILSELDQKEPMSFLPLEIELQWKIDSTKFTFCDSGEILEKDLESFLFHHLDKLESGLRPISRQQQISNGRLDILARDKNGQYVIIECKIKEDDRLLWQASVYPDATKQALSIREPIRMVTVAPKYSQQMIDKLASLGTEVYSICWKEYHKKVEDIELKKIA